MQFTVTDVNGEVIVTRTSSNGEVLSINTSATTEFDLNDLEASFENNLYAAV